jgi:hypothetical protein
MTDADRPPLDYVPVSRLDGAASFEPTKWLQPSALRRGAIAGVCGGVVAVVVTLVPAIALAGIGIGIILVAVHFADKLADRLNRYDGK